MSVRKICFILSVALCLTMVTVPVSAEDVKSDGLPNFYGRMDLNDEGFDENFKIVSAEFGSPTPLDQEPLVIGESGEYQYEILDSVELTDEEWKEYEQGQAEAVPFASRMDIAITNLRCEPYSAVDGSYTAIPGSYILNYAFSLLNYSDTTISNYPISIYFDNVLQGSTVLNNLRPGRRTEIGFKFPPVEPSNTLHTMKIVANENHSVSETSYTNNTASRQFKYVDSIELDAISITAAGNPKTLPINQDIEFTIAIVNAGTLSATNVPVDFPATFTVNNQHSVGNMKSLTAPNIPPHTQVTGKVIIRFLRPSSVQLGLYVNPNSTIKELSYVNNLATSVYQIDSGSSVNPDYTYELHGGFFNTRNITYAFSSEYPTPESKYVAAVQNGAAMWSNNTSLFSITQGNEINRNINVRVNDFGETDWNARSFIDNGKWAQAYSKTTLDINKFFFSGKQERDIRLVVGHELGHLLGLNHVEKDSCIMYAVYDPFDSTKNRGVQDAAAKYPSLYERPSNDDIVGADLACKNWNP